MEASASPCVLISMQYQDVSDADSEYWETFHHWMLKYGTVYWKEEEIAIHIACLWSFNGIQTHSSSSIMRVRARYTINMNYPLRWRKTRCWSKILTWTLTKEDPTGMSYVNLQQNLEFTVETIHICRIRPQERFQCSKITTFFDSFHKKTNCLTKFDRIQDFDTLIETYESGCPRTTKDSWNQCLFAKLWPPNSRVANYPVSRTTPPHFC